MATRPWKVTTKEIDGEKVRGIILPDMDLDRLTYLPGVAYLAENTHDEDGNLVDVQIPKNRFFPFAKPGKRLEKKRLFMVKAHHLGGFITQVPMEDQINNHKASPSTGLGLQNYIRKGFTIYWDPQDGATLFCAAWGCYAEAQEKFRGQFCCESHLETTVQDEGGAFSAGATTRESWTR
jgi:hypothetical protein